MKSKMTVLLTSMVVLTMALSLLVGCWPAADPAVEENGEVADVAAPAEVFRWTGQSKAPAGTFIHATFEEMAEAVYDASGGRLIIETHPTGAVVPGLDELIATHRGVLDIVLTCFTHNVGLWDAASISSTRVGGLTPLEKLGWYLEGGGHEMVEEMMEGYDVKIIRGAASLRTPEVFLFSNRELNSPEDLVGLKIRSVGDSGAVLARMGGAVAPLSLGEVYEAMKMGVIDAVEVLEPTGMWELAIHEVSDYMYLSGVRAPVIYGPIIVNTDSFDALPADLQAILEEVLPSVTMRKFVELMALDMVSIDKFREHMGADAVRDVPASIEQALFEEAHKYNAEAAAGDPLFARMLESQVEFQASMREAFTRY